MCNWFLHAEKSTVSATITKMSQKLLWWWIIHQGLLLKGKKIISLAIENMQLRYSNRIINLIKYSLKKDTQRVTEQTASHPVDSSARVKSPFC